MPNDGASLVEAIFDAYTMDQKRIGISFLIIVS